MRAEVEKYRVCWKCRGIIGNSKKVALCPVCRSTYGWGMMIGGFVVGVLAKVFSHFHWL